jgi:hypothetical protein
MKSRGYSKEVVDVLEAAGLLTPLNIKMADDADLEAAGLTPDEIKKVRAVCPAYRLSNS